MGLKFTGKAIFFYQKMYSGLGTKIYNILIYYMGLSHAMILSEFFSLSFSRPFYPPDLLLLASFLAALKSWVLTMGKAWKWVLDQL